MEKQVFSNFNMRTGDRHIKGAVPYNVAYGINPPEVDKFHIPTTMPNKLAGKHRQVYIPQACG